MAQVERFKASHPLVSGFSGRPRNVNKRTQRAMDAIDGLVSGRIGAVRAEEAVTKEKLNSLDRLGREAGAGELTHRAAIDAMVDGDMFAAAAVQPYRDIVRVGKIEMLAHTIDAYCEESRRWW